MSRPGGESSTRVAGTQGLTREGLDALLSNLDSDRSRAAEKYEAIRRKLIRLFEWRGCEFAEDLADETINRVARRMAGGVKIDAPDPFGYFCGVAHLVYKEVWRHAKREQKALDSGGWPPPPSEEEPDDRRLTCLHKCLQQLSEEQRDLLLRYHQGEDNIRNRKVLSDELGIPINALRIRVHRVRRKIEGCIEDCLRR